MQLILDFLIHWVHLESQCLPNSHREKIDWKEKATHLVRLPKDEKVMVASKATYK